MSVLKKLLVELVKVGNTLVFVAKYLYHLLSVHHFLGKALDLTKCRLLTEKEFCRAAADLFDNNGHYDNANGKHQRQPHAVVKHNAVNGDYRHRRHNKLRKALRNHLAQGINIVCVMAHYVAVIVCIKVLDGQPFHFREHFSAHFIENALSYNRHQLIINNVCQKGKKIETNQNQNVFEYFSANRAPVCCLPAFFNGGEYLLHKNSGYRAYRRAEKDTAECYRQHNGIVAENGFYQAGNNALVLIILHLRHLPYSAKGIFRGKFHCFRAVRCDCLLR